MATQKAAFASEKKLTVATGEWKPFISSDAPDFGPLSAKVAKTFAQMGYKIEIEIVPWNRAYQLTQKGHYAASFAWFWTEKRAAELLVPDAPIRAFDHSVFYNTNRFPDGLDKEFRTLDDLANCPYRLVGVKGYWYVSEIEKLGGSLHTAPNLASAFRLIKAGRYDILLENRDVGFMEVESILGHTARPDFEAVGSVPAGDLFVMFSPNHALGEKLLKLYNAAASNQTVSH